MYDATPLQIIAHGFVPTPTGTGVVAGAVTEGVLTVTRTAPGITLIVLDTGVPGGGTVALPDDLRVSITPQTPQGVPPFPVSADAEAINTAPPPTGTGATSVVVRTWNLVTDVNVDNGYWFIISRPAQSETT